MSAMVGNTIRKGIFDTSMFSSFSQDHAEDWNKRNICDNSFTSLSFNYTTERYIDEIYCPTQIEATNQKNCSFPFTEVKLQRALDSLNNQSVFKPREYCRPDYKVSYDIAYPKYPSLEDYLSLESERGIRRPDLELVYSGLK